jgi:hypothetical protein
MSENKLTQYVRGFGLSFFATSIASALLVIAKEENAALKDAMKALSGHHWTTHGIVVVGLFIILGFVLSKLNLDEKLGENRLVPMILTGAFAGVLLITGFFLIE